MAMLASITPITVKGITVWVSCHTLAVRLTFEIEEAFKCNASFFRVLPLNESLDEITLNNNEVVQNQATRSIRTVMLPGSFIKTSVDKETKAETMSLAIQIHFT